MKTTKHLSGFKGFSLVWVGQVISVIASAMQVAYITPFLVLTPLAGALVDRYNRKLMMMVSDLGAVLSTVVILLLYINGNLAFWHLYVAAVFNGIGYAFQKPAYSAVISTMLPKQQYGRANGMMELLRSGPDVVAPALAGALLAVTLQGLFDSFALILLIDLLTFGCTCLEIFSSLPVILFMPRWFWPAPGKTV
jgi:MFS family permease